MASSLYFQFLDAVWDQLPSEDRERFGEIWQGYEQVLAAAYQKYAEVNLNVAVADLLPWATERWLPYTFDDTNFVQRAASITSTQDMSRGVNLTKKHLLKFRLPGDKVFEVDVRGVIPARTTIDEIIEKINLSAGFIFASSLYENTILYLKASITGVNSFIEVLETSDPDANACEFVLGISALEIPRTYPRFRYPYSVPYAKVSSIPTMQDNIRDESVTVSLVEGTDYSLESNGTILAFRDLPPASLWAVRTHTDLENPWANFGFLTGIYQKNSPRYVGVIQGLWYAFWNGPKPSNVRRALYLLFGLPTAQEAGTVTGVTATQIQTTGDNGIVRIFDIPTNLESLVSVGDRVVTFDPLVSGIWVYDKINYPGFIKAEAGREGVQRFLTENASIGIGTETNPTDEDKALVMLEEYTFLPQISVDAFIYPDINLRNVRLFLDSFKPLNKTYLFQIIVGLFRDLLGLTDRVGLLLDIDLTSNLDSNETTFQSQSVLDSYEVTDIDALNVDPHGILFEERLEVEVYSGLIQIDSFTA